MKKFIVTTLASLAVVLGFLGSSPAPANASSPAQAKYAEFFYHAPVGNAQSFAVKCYSDGSVHWLGQGAYSQNAGQCPFTGKVNQIYVPANFRLCMRDYYGGAGTGCVYYISGGVWVNALPGAWYAWTVHV